MQGLRLAKLFYEDVAAPILQQKMGTIMNNMAIGLVGEGSECFGFDDILSRDHDFGAGFCLWVPHEKKEAFMEPLAAAFAALPNTFMGFPVRLKQEENALTGQRLGLFSIEEFYQRFCNIPRAPQSWQEWYVIPEHFLAVATNGAVFFDALGQFSTVRQDLLDFYPEDVRKKKLAARLSVMAQSGQYNLPRLLQRKDGVGAHLACTRFMECAMAAYFLLHKRYMPFYKWAHKSLTKLPQGQEFSAQLQELLCFNLIEMCQNPSEQRNNEFMALVENICLRFVHLLNAQELSSLEEPWLMAQAEYLQSSITQDAIRSLPLSHGVHYS